jgi:hypothetical protein
MRRADEVPVRILLAGLLSPAVPAAAAARRSASRWRPRSRAAGAPTGNVQVSDPDLACMGRPGRAGGSSIERLPGHVRTLADPTATADLPAARVEAFTPTGSLLGFGFADTSKQGRSPSRCRSPATASTATRWHPGRLLLPVPDQPWLVTTPTSTATPGWSPRPRSTPGRPRGASPVDAGAGILLGSALDCQAFALENVWCRSTAPPTASTTWTDPTPMECPTLQACDRPFAAATGATFTNDTGRFLMANVPAGPVVVKVFGRLAAGGPLTLLARIDTEVTAGAITAVGMRPRMGVD